MKRVALYLRVSTTDQSTAMQAEELRAYAATRAWTVVATYEDQASGTKTTGRPQLHRLLKDSKARKFDAVLVWKLDRFARSLKDLVNMLQELSDFGVEFVSIRDNIDFTTASGRLMMHMIGAFAEFEATLIRERVRAGIKSAKAKGVRFGRPGKHDYGKILALREKGMSFRDIERQLSVNRGIISRALKLAKAK